MSPLRTDPDPGGTDRSVPEFSTILAGPNYFHVAGIRLIEGRYPDSLTAPAQAEPRTAPKEVVVNRGLAARFWPNGGALGAHLHTEFNPSDRENFIVVGIAEDVHMPGARQVARSAVLYQPPFLPFLPSFVVRTAVPATDLLPALRRAITSIQPTPYIQTTTVGDTFLRDTLAPPRFAMQLLAAFAPLSLILATVGLSSVLSFAVTHRTS